MECLYNGLEWLANLLLPSQANFQLINVVFSTKQFQLTVRTKTASSRCPDCQTISRRVNSQAERTVKDLPVSGVPTILLVQLKRFFCDNPVCNRKTFNERFSGVIEPYAHRTNRLLELQRSVGFLSGGETGAKLTRCLALPTSPDSLLRFVRTAPLCPVQSPVYLGVDDWAFKKGHSYGTMLVDLETRRPVDLLPNRDPETVAQWLKAHPGINLVTRDRSASYREAIRMGAPDAIQVADRFHLLHNLVDVVERVLTRRYMVLQTVFKETFLTPPKTEWSEEMPSNAPAPARKSTQYEQQRQLIREKHQVQHMEIHQLKAQGMGIRAISRQLHLSREKVQRYFYSDQPPVYQRRKMKNMLDPYRAYIEQRWQAGQRNGVQIWQEIRAMGYPGTYQSMAREIRHLRAAMPRKTKQLTKPKAPTTPPPPKLRPFSVRQTTWLLIKPLDQLEGDSLRYVTQLLASSDDFHRLHELIRAFWEIVTCRKRDKLAGWMNSAQESGIMEMKYFVNGLNKDLSAVEAALTYEWSNGVVEGHNNRLKMIKRQMYGRAKFDLLRQRVLYSG
jgi:transposase